MKWNVVLFSLQELKLRRWHWWTAWQLIYTSWWWETNTSVSIQKKKTQLEEKQTLKKTQNDSFCLYSAAFLLQTNGSSPQNPPGRQSLSFRPRELTYTCLNRHIKHPVSMKSFLYCWNSWATNPLFTSWLSCCCTLTPAQIKSVNLKGHRMLKAGGPTQKQQMNMTPVFSPVLSTPSSLRSSCEDSTLRRACCCWKPDRYRSKQFTHSLVVLLWASISIWATYCALRSPKGGKWRLFLMSRFQMWKMNSSELSPLWLILKS